MYYIIVYLYITKELHAGLRSYIVRAPKKYKMTKKNKSSPAKHREAMKHVNMYVRLEAEDLLPVSLRRAKYIVAKLSVDQQQFCDSDTHRTVAMYYNS